MSGLNDRMKYEAFFFDFDGVLADSVEVKTKAFAKLFESYGLEIQSKVVEHHRKHGGLSRNEKFRHYYEKLLKKPLYDDEMEQLCNAFSLLVVDEVAASPEIPGAESFLKKWHKVLPCFVVSAAPEIELNEIINKRKLDRYFTDILGSFRSKKENLELLIDKYSFDPFKCIFFGDAESDYRAAKALRVNFIGILPGPDAPLLQVAQDIIWVRCFIDLNIEKFGIGIKERSVYDSSIIVR